MAIKRISVKGITRVPSGQVALDGECSESLNVELDHGEVAPVLAPKMIDPATGDATDSWSELEAYYVHKGNGYENIISVYGNGLYSSMDSSSPFDTLESGETIVNICSVGNTLVITTSKRMRYYLYKDSNYSYLGEKIPEPDVFIYTWGYTRKSQYQVKKPGTDTPVIFPLSSSFWQSVKQKRDLGIVDADTHAADVYEQDIWDGTRDVLRRFDADLGTYYVRYAVRLYDDSHIYTSVPILINSSTFIQFLAYTPDPSTPDPVGLLAVTEIIGRGRMRVPIWEISGWEDIVKSLDIYITPYFIHPFDSAHFKDVDYASGSDPGGQGYDWHLIADTTAQERIDQYLNADTFYLVKSIKPEELSEYIYGHEIIEDKFRNMDVLAVQERLVEGYRDNHYYYLERLKDFNNRLLSAGIKYRLNNGYKYANGIVFYAENTDYYIRKYTYVIETDSGTFFVLAQDEEGARSGESWDWLAYPDTRCTGVYVTIENDDTHVTNVKYYEMKPHPSLQIAYYLSVGHSFERQTGSDVAPQPSENPVVEEPNTLALSRYGNPFVFDPTGYNTLGGKILNSATIAYPLSEGQAGQFDIYVFTDEGVYAAKTTSTGELSMLHVISRDILVSPDALVGFEQAVAFAAQRGVLLIQGNGITNISESMDGPQQDLSGTASDIISFLTQKLGFDVDSLDEYYISEFVKGSQMLFDAAGRRIIIFRSDLDVQLCYKLETQTWHRLRLDTGWSWVRPLNSFPESRIVAMTTTVIPAQSSSPSPIDVGPSEPVSGGVGEEIQTTEPGVEPGTTGGGMEQQPEWPEEPLEPDGPEEPGTENPDISGDNTEQPEGGGNEGEGGSGEDEPSSGEGGNDEPQETTTIEYSILDFSVHKGETDSVLNGFFVTREMSFGELDMYKSIKRVKIRGRYAQDTANTEGHVKWALQGSNDGETWTTIHSLRGPSWKWVRFIVLTKLAKNERISYIEVEYEPKFRNKLR